MLIQEEAKETPPQAPEWYTGGGGSQLSGCHESCNHVRERQYFTKEGADGRQPTKAEHYTLNRYKTLYKLISVETGPKQYCQLQVLSEIHGFLALCTPGKFHHAAFLLTLHFSLRLQYYSCFGQHYEGQLKWCCKRTPLLLLLLLLWISAIIVRFQVCIMYCTQKACICNGSHQ